VEILAEIDWVLVFGYCNRVKMESIEPGVETVRNRNGETSPKTVVMVSCEADFDFPFCNRLAYLMKRLMG